ncbi:MAG: hypothetical protein NE334_21790 [Lentisphaeraceae bacterium]|nr:hypothetical protein [Lentisphaeraceae bacterium]
MKDIKKDLLFIAVVSSTLGLVTISIWNFHILELAQTSQFSISEQQSIVLGGLFSVVALTRLFIDYSLGIKLSCKDIAIELKKLTSVFPLFTILPLVEKCRVKSNWLFFSKENFVKQYVANGILFSQREKLIFTLDREVEDAD